MKVIVKLLNRMCKSKCNGSFFKLQLILSYYVKDLLLQIQKVKSVSTGL